MCHRPNVPTLDIDTVLLVPGKIVMKERRELTIYIIKKWELVYRDKNNKKLGIKMEITLKRRIMNEMMTTYLPSILLILTTYATTFFKPFYFEAALTVNLTTMLVLTTIFIAVMEKLPSTAYVKMIDVWLIFGQLIPFTEVVLLTMMEYLRVGDERGELMINNHGEERIVFVGSSVQIAKSPVTDVEADSVPGSVEERQTSAHLQRQTPIVIDGSTLAQLTEERKLALINSLQNIESRVLPATVVIITLIYISVCALFFTELV